MSDISTDVSTYHILSQSGSDAGRPGGAEIAGATVFVLVQAIIYGTFLLNLLAYKDCAE